MNLQSVDSKVESLKEQVNSDLFDLKSNVDEQLEAVAEEFGHELDGVKLHIAKLAHDLETSKSTTGDQSMSNTSGIALKIQALEDEIAQLTARTAQQYVQQGDKFSLQAVFGGLQQHISLTDAKAWLTEKLQNTCKAKVEDVYCKGDFRGFLFAEFCSTDVHNDVVKSFRQAQLEHGGMRVWVTANKLLEVRAQLSVI